MAGTIPPEQISREEAAPGMSWLWFGYLNPLFEIGTQRPIESWDLGVTGHADTASTVGRNFNKAWNVEVQAYPAGERSLWRVVANTVGPRKLMQVP